MPSCSYFFVLRQLASVTLDIIANAQARDAVIRDYLVELKVKVKGRKQCVGKKI